MIKISRYRLTAARTLCASLVLLILLGMFAPLALAKGACMGGCCIGVKAETQAPVSMRMISADRGCCCGDTAVEPCRRVRTLASNPAVTILRHAEDSRQCVLSLSGSRVLSQNPPGIKFSPRLSPRLFHLKTPLYIQTAALLC